MTIIGGIQPNHPFCRVRPNRHRGAGQRDSLIVLGQPPDDLILIGHHFPVLCICLINRAFGTAVRDQNGCRADQPVEELLPVIRVRIDNHFSRCVQLWAFHMSQSRPVGARLCISRNDNLAGLRVPGHPVTAFYGLKGPFIACKVVHHLAVRVAGRDLNSLVLLAVNHDILRQLDAVEQRAVIIDFPIINFEFKVAFCIRCSRIHMKAEPLFGSDRDFKGLVRLFVAFHIKD